MNLKNRVSRLERTCQNRLNCGADDRSSQHDRVSADHLLRLWEDSDDWVRQRTEMVIGKCDGLSVEARIHLQERLRTLQTGCPREILLVLAGLSRDCPGWYSPREDDVIRAALRGDPALVKAAAECGILGAGRKDWGAFACWLERRATGDLVCDRVLVEAEPSPSSGLPP
jgi:hypothetical protein